MNTKIIKLKREMKKANNSNINNVTTDILQAISKIYEDSNQRDCYILSQYYGICSKPLTLESIGAQLTPTLTRERVRQVINNLTEKIKTLNIDNIYTKTNKSIQSYLSEKSFLLLDEILKKDYFSVNKNRNKGLLAFLKDCGISQVSYRGKTYLYISEKYTKSEVIKNIKIFNKTIRKQATLKKSLEKIKTATHIPQYVKDHLHLQSKKQNIGLNELYVKIINGFFLYSPYRAESYVFTKTKSSNQIQPQDDWVQLGLYIPINTFNEIKKHIAEIKSRKPQSNVTLMNFLCQAFIWHHNKYQ